MVEIGELREGIRKIGLLNCGHQRCGHLVSVQELGQGVDEARAAVVMREVLDRHAHTVSRERAAMRAETAYTKCLNQDRPKRRRPVKTRDMQEKQARWYCSRAWRREVLQQDSNASGGAVDANEVEDLRARRAQERQRGQRVQGQGEARRRPAGPRPARRAPKRRGWERAAASTRLASSSSEKPAMGSSSETGAMASFARRRRRRVQVLVTRGKGAPGTLQDLLRLKLPVRCFACNFTFYIF